MTLQDYAWMILVAWASRFANDDITYLIDDGL